MFVSLFVCLFSPCLYHHLVCIYLSAARAAAAERLAPVAAQAAQGGLNPPCLALPWPCLGRVCLLSGSFPCLVVSFSVQQQSLSLPD